MVGAQRELLARPPRQLPAVDLVARIQLLEVGAQRDAAHLARVAQRPAVDAGPRDVDGQGGVGHETADAVVEAHQLHLVAGLRPGQAHIGVLAALGLQRRVAEAGEVQLVERGREERGAVRGMHPPGRREAEAVAGEAGVGAAELRVAVAAQVELPAVRTRAAIEPAEDRADVAAGDAVGRGGADALLALLQARQHHAQRGVHLVLPGELGLGGLEVGGRVGFDVVGRVAALRDPQLGLPGRQQPALEPGLGGQAADGTARIDAGAIVEMADAVRVQQAALQRPAGAEVVAQGGRERVLPEGIAVRVVVVEGHVRLRGVEAALGQALHRQRILQRPLPRRQAGGRERVALAAHRERRVRVEALAALAGEHLHHAGHAFAPVQGRGRALEHLDALDHLHRDRFPAGRAGRGRADAHAVHQQDGVAVLAAADEDVGGLAAAAVGRHLHARGAGQQLGQGAGGRGLDLGALDDAHVAHQFIGDGGAAGGGDHGFPQGGRLGVERK